MAVSGRAMEEIRIVLVDDSEAMLGALRAVLETQPDMTVVGEARSGEEALALAVQQAPDVVLLDVAMPGMSGAETAQRLGELLPAVKILAFSGHDQQGHVRRMFDAGAGGYLRKSAEPEEIVRAIRQVAAGARYVDPAIDARIGGALAADPPAGEGELPADHVKVLALFAQGYPMRQIAAMLALDHAEVERLKADGMRQLGVTARADLARLAAARGWI
jgi:DNA-binding NarL/FixJ family response regulator